MLLALIQEFEKEDISVLKPVHYIYERILNEEVEESGKMDYHSCILQRNNPILVDICKFLKLKCIVYCKRNKHSLHSQTHCLKLLTKLSVEKERKMTYREHFF